MDITYYYNDWIAIGNIIKNMFDEEGRALFHKVSSFYPNYDYDETDSEYSAMIVGQYRYNSDRLFEIAAKYGLIPGQRKILRGISDKILSLCETNESSAIMETNGYRLLLPEGTLDYFNISDVKESSSEIVIYLEEKNELPGEYSTVKVESKGFYDPVVVRDFPIRGKNLFLNIRRRRWILKDDGRYVSRNWKLVAEGSRMTHEFASFLKELY